MDQVIMGADNSNQNGGGKRKQALLRLKNLQTDFFIADFLDAAPKDDMASMEHPVFALKVGDRRVRQYQRGDVNVEIQPGAKGLATIHDKDVWIYCISQLMEAKRRGVPMSRTIRFRAYDFLVSTNRQTSGHGYKLLAEALERLAGTRIVTNIETADHRETNGFGLVDTWRVVEQRPDNRMVAIQVTLSEWLYRAVEADQVLTLSRDYFRLRKPLDRRIYELARKHCGKQESWRATIPTLHEKSGSAAGIREFRRSIRSLEESGDLPDYRIQFDQDADAVTFTRRTP